MTLPRNKRYAVEGHTHAGGGSSYTPPVRGTVVQTTTTLAAGARWQGTIAGFAGYRVLAVQTDRAARVRLYTDTTRQAADAARAVGTDPTGDHGVQLDYVTTSGVLSWLGAPPVDGFVSAGTAIPLTVDNLSGSSATVTVTLTLLRTE